ADRGRRRSTRPTADREAVQRRAGRGGHRHGTELQHVDLAPGCGEQRGEIPGTLAVLQSEVDAGVADQPDVPFTPERIPGMLAVLPAELALDAPDAGRDVAQPDLPGALCRLGEHGRDALALLGVGML